MAACGSFPIGGHDGKRMHGVSSPPVSFALHAGERKVLYNRMHVLYHSLTGWYTDLWTPSPSDGNSVCQSPAISWDPWVCANAGTHFAFTFCWLFFIPLFLCPRIKSFCFVYHDQCLYSLLTFEFTIINSLSALMLQLIWCYMKIFNSCVDDNPIRIFCQLPEVSLNAVPFLILFICFMTRVA